MTAWVWAFALTLLVAAFLLLARRQRVQRRFVRERSPEHEAQVAALTEWLGVPKIRRSIMEHEGVSGRAQDGIRATLGTLDKASLDNVLHARILGFREVRRVIAGHIAQTHKVSRFEAMKALLEWAGKVKEVA